MPGTMPAINNWEMDTEAVTPITIKGIDGGIIGAIMPPAAIKPAERGPSYLAFIIIGNMMAAMAAVSAAGEPDSEAIIIAAIITTKPKPPALWPTNFIGKSIKRLAKL